MILGAAHIGELVREIAPLVQGLRIREVCARPPRDLLLVLEDPRASEGPPAWRLLVSADPDAPRLHLVRGRFERHAGPLGPFFRRAIEELEGLEIRALTQVAGDRIVALEARGARTRTLVAELVGRHSNLVLLEPGDRVVAVLVPPPHDRTDPRSDPARQVVPRLVPARVYAPPPGRPGKPSGTTLAETIVAPSTVPPLRRDERENVAPLSWIVENALGTQAAEAQEGRARKQLEERAERKLKNARALVFGLEKKLEASAQSERVQQDGELLKANLAVLKRGAKHVEVDDFYDASGSKRRIDLDPKLSPSENLARVFERARKLERARDVVGAELALAQAKVASLEKLLADARVDGADHEALDRAAVVAGLLDRLQEGDPRKRKEPAPRLPYRAFHAHSGAEIRVGRTAKDNDDLTFHHANGNDIWMHTADTPGSHVVLRTPKDSEPSDEDVLDAAHLALHFSPMKDARKARVHIARRKEVHKPRGAKPGLVTLSGGRILDLRVQPERLARLLGSHRAPGGDGGA